MTPKHHPSDATLLTYAAGSLGEGLSLVVASHLAFCDECRAAVAAGEVVGGDLFEALEPEALAASARDRTLALLDAPVAAAPVVPLPLPLDPALPAPLGRYLKRDLGAIPWRVLSPGLKHFEVLPHDLVGGANLRLLRIAPGRRLPRHGHAGTELTLVLTGSYSDELGRFVRGDVAETDGEIVHEPVSDRDEDCICLIAIEGRLKFEGRIARLFQRFSGM
jgi:putative transcriptional regulator